MFERASLVLTQKKKLCGFCDLLFKNLRVSPANEECYYGRISIFTLSTIGKASTKPEEKRES